MIPEISQAISKGFNSKQIIDYLLKKFPEYSGKIKDAMAAGFTIDQVLKFISGGKKALSKIEKTSEEGNTEFQQMRNRDISRKENVDKRFLQGAGLAATAAITPIASQAAASALSRALPQSVQKIMPEIQPSIVPSMTGQGMQPAQPSQELPQVTSNQTLPQQPPIDSGNANIIPKTDTLEQPKENINIVDTLWNDLEKTSGKKFGFKSDAFLKIARRMKSTGEIRSKEDFQNFFNLFEQKKNEGKDLPSALREASNQFDQEKLSSNKDQIETPKIEKRSIVSTPQGFGDVVTSRNGKSIVDVNGKRHQVEDSKILRPPKEAALEAMELIKSFTPEKQRSTHHMLNAYEPDSKQGFFVFHNGSAYVVDDISEEEYKELSEEIEQAKTSGETIIGKWAEGEGSRGSAYNKVVKGIRDRKVVPELKKKFKKLQVGYNLLAEWQRLLNEK